MIADVIDEHDGRGRGVEAEATRDIGRQVNRHLLLDGLAQEVTCVRQLVGLDLARADLLAHRLEEGVRHRATDHDRVDLLEQGIEYFDLVGDLRAAEHGDVRTIDLAEQARQELDLLCHHEARTFFGDELHHARGRGMRAMRGTERVVDVDVAVRSERTRHRLVVGFLARIPAQVLEHRDLTIAQVGDDLPRAVAYRLVGERDIDREQLGELRGDRFERELRLDLPVGAPEVRTEHDARAALDQVLERRQRRADARVVGDLLGALLERHVVVDAHEHALALDRELFDGLDAARQRHYRRSATNAARSSRRCE